MQTIVWCLHHAKVGVKIAHPDKTSYRVTCPQSASGNRVLSSYERTPLLEIPPSLHDRLRIPPSFISGQPTGRHQGRQGGVNFSARPKATQGDDTLANRATLGHESRSGHVSWLPPNLGGAGRQAQGSLPSLLFWAPWTSGTSGRRTPRVAMDQEERLSILVGIFERPWVSGDVFW